MDNLCKVCKGSKVRSYDAFTGSDGKVYPAHTMPCHACDGMGEFPPVDVEAIVAIIVATRGKNKGSIRAAMTSPRKSDGVQASRAYYVWRIARFHGGKDVTMPWTADMITRGDPFKAELDALADAVAKRCFGTDMAAAMTWGLV